MSTAEIIAKGKRRARRRNRAVRQTLGETMQGAAARRSCPHQSRTRGSSDFNMRSYEPVESIARALRVLRTVSEFEIVHHRGHLRRDQDPEIHDRARAGDADLRRLHRARQSVRRLSHHLQGERSRRRTKRHRTHHRDRPPDHRRPDEPETVARQHRHASMAMRSGFASRPPALCKRANAVSLGWRLDLFYSAMGRAYLAFCSAAERERIFKARSMTACLTRAMRPDFARCCRKSGRRGSRCAAKTAPSRLRASPFPSSARTRCWGS